MKKKRKKHINLFLTLFLMFVITSSIGYSLLSDNLSVSGSASASYVISGNALKIGLTANGTGGATYTSGTFPTAFATLTSEVLSGNTLTLTFTRTKTQTTNVSCSFVINFKNIYPYTMGSGTKSVTKVTGGNNASSLTATLSKTSITAQSTAKLTVAGSFRTSVTTVVEVKATMTYVTQGVSQTFNYIIKIL
jgi:hypothetical protein